MSAKYKSPSFLLPNELNTSANPLNTDGNAATGTGINSLYSMDFDGSSHINCGNDSSLTPTNSISISLWIKTNTTSQTQFSGPLDKHVSGTGGYQFFFPNSSSSEIKFALGNPKVSLTSTTQVGDTNWHHILATCDNVNCKLYIDGVLESTVSANLSTLSNSENLKIGGDGVSTFYFNGQIDEVAIFNRALNTTEIAALYEGTGSNIRPSNLIASNLNPIAYYPLGEQAQMQGYLGNEASSEWQFPNGVLQDYVMDFDGATIGDYIDVGDIPLEGVYTISFWINPDASPSSISFLLDKGDGSSNISVRVTQRNNNAIRFQIGSSYLESTDTLTNNSWNNVILIANGSSSKIYINNGTSPNGTLTTAPNTTQSLLIGTDEGRQSTYYFNGQMSNVVIWNSDQSTNIADIYNNGSPQTTYTVTPQNWWKLNADSVYTPSAPNYTKALDFGGSQSVDTNYTGLDGLSKATISLWVKPDVASANGTIFNARDGSAVGMNCQFFTSKTYLYFTGSINIISANYTPPFSDNLWANLVIVFDGTLTGNDRIKLYANGETKVIDTYNGTIPAVLPTSSTSLKIAESFNGQVSNFAIFNSALTSSQVSTLFNFGTPETNISFSPQAWWKLDDQTAITDSSGNGNTGTNNGATNAPGGVAVTPSWKIPSALPITTINYKTAGSFNGTSSKIVTTEENLGTTNTISFWHKRPTGMGSNKVVIGGNTLNRFDGTILLNAGQLIIGFPTDKALFFLGPIFNASQNASGVNIPYEDVWVHYCITRNGTTQSDIKLYINSYLVTTSRAEYFGAVDYTTNTTIFNVGAASGQSIFSEGELSNVSTFSSAFAQAQVNTLYNNGQPSADISSLSPVNWWKLDTIGSTITDNGSAGNNGTNTDVTAATTDVKTSDLNIPVNGVSTTLPSTALQQSDLQFDSPYSNYSLSFDGTGDYITVTQDFSSYTSMSVSGWVRTASTSQYQYLFSTGVYNGGTPGNGQGFGIGFDNTGKFAAWAGGANYFTFGSVSANTWYHVIQTITGTTLRFYVNGVLTSTQTVGSFNIPSSAIAVIGAYSGNSIPTQSNLYGKADELSIFNYELTTSQVLEIYNNGRPKDLTTFSGTAPTNWWRLGENAYFNDVPAFTVPNSISGAPNGTGSGSITTMISADAPGTYANGVGTNLDILDRVGDAALSTSNSQSYNMIPSDISPYVPQYVGDQIANNSSMLFNGADEFFNTTGLSVAGYSAVSISAWVNFSSMNPAGRIIYENTNSAAYVRIALNITTANKLESELRLTSTGTNYTITGNTTLSTGVNDWYNVVLVYDSGSTYKIYVNGSEDGTATAPTGSFISTASANSFRIGSGISQNYFDGKIDEVAIFDKALTADQIKFDLYEPSLPLSSNKTADIANNPNLPTPVAWYRMGD